MRGFPRAAVLFVLFAVTLALESQSREDKSSAYTRPRDEGWTHEDAAYECVEQLYAPRAEPARLFDAFMFSNELELLELRLYELYPVVHRFVLVEARRTFSGKSKDLVFARSRERFEAYADKIVYVEAGDNVTLCDGEMNQQHDRRAQLEAGCGPWAREREQRDSIAFGLREAGVTPEDVVLISDVDELLPRSAAETLRWCHVPMPLTIPSELFYFSFRWRITYTNGMPFIWEHPQAALAHQLKAPDGQCVSSSTGAEDSARRHSCKWTPDGLRSQPSEVKFFSLVAGWHCSYFGGSAAVRKKLASYSHTEVDRTEITDSSHVQRCIREGRPLTGDVNLLNGQKLNNGAVPERQPSYARRRPILALIYPENFEVLLTGGEGQAEEEDEEPTQGSCEAFRMRT